MLKSRKMQAVLLGVVLAGFVIGVIHLFQLRFSSGDIYPPYSSLRADPLGVKIYYESLQQLPGISVDRFFQQDDKIHGDRQSALYIIGASEWTLESMSQEDYRSLQKFVHEGGRLVISLFPTTATETPTEHATSENSETNTDLPVIKTIHFLATNGLSLKYGHLAGNADDVTPVDWAEASGDYPGLASRVSWHSTAYFEQSNSDWRVVYNLNDHPVVIEKPFGAGSVVLSTDSYFLSNEALRKERHSELLAWLTGDRQEILFDETHLGVEQQVGVAVLMRQYHLEGTVIALLLLAGFFVWKNALPLVPPLSDESFDGEKSYVVGKESSAGLISLLRRSIPEKDILFTSFEEWKTACGRDPRIAACLPQIQTIIDAEKAKPSGSQRPVETYQAIHQILTKRHL